MPSMQTSTQIHLSTHSFMAHAIGCILSYFPVMQPGISTCIAATKWRDSTHTTTHSCTLLVTVMCAILSRMPTKRCFTSRLAHAHKIIHEQTETGSQGAVQTTVLKWNKMRRNKGEIGTGRYARSKTSYRFWNLIGASMSESHCRTQRVTYLYVDYTYVVPPCINVYFILVPRVAPRYAQM